jgi:putative endopeptidase
MLIAAPGTGRAASGNSQSAARPPAPISGVDLQYADNSVRAQDDFYQHVNGKWISVTKIPPDRSRYGAFDKLRDDTLDQLHSIVEHLQKEIDDSDPDQRKIADLYASFMDQAAAEKLDLTPLQGEFARIAALTNKQQMPALIAHFNRIGVSAPYESDVNQDAKDPRNYAFVLSQSGLALPDRDYYLLDDAKFKLARGQYLSHIEKMFGFTGDENAWQSAQDVLTLETELAQLQWTNVQNRDPVRTYNKIEIARLSTLGPDYDWNSYLNEAGVQGKINYLLIEQPDYIAGLTKLLARVPLSVWKTYFRWHLLSDYSSFLSKRFVDEDFTFNGTALRGTPKNTARWKRAVDLVNQAIGEGLGRMYVAEYFPPASKDRMDQLVKNLLAAYRADIATLDWMSPETKLKAQAKLAKLVPKIGYPQVWRQCAASFKLRVREESG